MSAALIHETRQLGLTIEVGGMPVRVNTYDEKFVDMLSERYAGFMSDTPDAEMVFDVDLIAPTPSSGEDVSVRRDGRWWILRRGDFRAEWDPETRRGWIRQTANPYSIDAVLRIVHTLVLARQGGFLAHAASAIRNGRAFLFAGVSEAGKTTISRLAPPDATLLTDEISYVRKAPALAEPARSGAPDSAYVAYGTPFTGELAKLGENVSAPLKALYFLAKGKENRIDAMDPAEAARQLLANMLFFAEDEELVQAMFHTAFEFVSTVPTARLTFVPDARVWELIG